MDEETGEERKRGCLEGKDTNMLFSLALGTVFVIIFAAGFYPFMWGPENGEVVVVLPSGYFHYHGHVFMEKLGLANVTQVMPSLHVSTRSYTYRDVSTIARALGIANPSVFEKDGYFYVSSDSGTLVVYKNGRNISYRGAALPGRSIAVSDQKLIEMANRYIENLSIAVPYGVNLVPHIAGGIPENGTNGTYLAREIDYQAYFMGYPVELYVKITLGDDGRVYSFYSSPVIVEYRDFVRIKSLSSVYRDMEKSGYPVPVAPSLIHRVVVGGVSQGYVYVGGELYPAYFMDTRVFYGYDQYMDYVAVAYVK